MLKNLILAFLLFFSLQSFAQTYLNVQDPQSTRYSSQGTIEEAVFSISPKGLFSQVSSYLTFSGRGGTFLPNSQLEIVFRFTLPNGSLVTDLWLWLDDKTISKGKVYDVWTASTIYEGIVNRRKDPAILKKTGTINYELRVYPVFPTGTRKVKITYLVPNNWIATTVSTPIPTEWLAISKNKTTVFDVVTWKSDEWINPVISNQTKSFEDKNDSFFGEHLRWDLSYLNYSNSCSLSFASPMSNGVYLKLYQNKNNEGFYQLSFFPASNQPIAPQKTLFLFDYDIAKTTVSRQQVVDAIKNTLLANFNYSDKFNVFYSGLFIGRLRSDWIPASEQNILGTLPGFKSDSISTYSNLPMLLKEAYQYLVKEGGGNICLIASSNQVGEITSANQLISDLQKIMSIKIPTYILDVANKNNNFYFTSGSYYLGNEYFYNNLSKITGGIYQKMVNADVANNLGDLLQKIGNSIKEFDFYTTLQDGFCYGRFNIGSSLTQPSFRKPMLQIGKYFGTLPFYIKAAGTYNNNTFSQSMTITNETNRQGDDLIEKLWIGSNILNLESGPVTNSSISEMVNLSVANRILSKNSAFLALEDTTSWCKDCYKDAGNGTTTTGVEDAKELPTEFSLSAYPNPFNPQVTITIKLTATMVGKNFSVKIYNMLGQVVKTFNLDDFQGKRIINLVWNGKDDSGQHVSSGIYFFNVAGSGINKSLKLVYMK